MRQLIKFLVPALAASVLLSACGSSSTKSAGSGSVTKASASGSGASVAVVKTASNETLGATVLVDGQGMTLYHLSGEQNGKFICTSSGCVQVWHPLTVQAGSTPSGTVGSLATVKRPDGTVQVTYRGTPLYTFAQDTAAGQANGQAIKDVGTWSAVTVSSGNATTTSTTSAPATSPGGGGEGKGGYGY
jgi:predicted lipoprotein with Yx(FWY)xxD motif